MRIARLEKDGVCGWYALGDDGKARALGGSPFGDGLGSPRARADVSWTERELRAPIEPHAKIVCVGRNYAAHAKELGNEVPAEPLLFFKPTSSVVGPGRAIVLPPESARVEHEAELAIVVGKRVRRVPRERAMEAVFGYTCACDVSARDLQKKDGQWARAKGFDTFCPLGPWIETELDVRDLGVRCLVDGALRQNGRTSNMIFDVATIVAYVSNAFTLEPGDVILTGTPEGVGPLSPGNRVVVAIDGIGELAMSVEAEPLDAAAAPRSTGVASPSGT